MVSFVTTPCRLPCFLVYPPARCGQEVAARDSALCSLPRQLGPGRPITAACAWAVSATHRSSRPSARGCLWLKGPRPAQHRPGSGGVRPGGAQVPGSGSHCGGHGPGGFSWPVPTGGRGARPSGGTDCGAEDRSAPGWRCGPGRGFAAVTRGPASSGAAFVGATRSSAA